MSARRQRDDRSTYPERDGFHVGDAPPPPPDGLHVEPRGDHSAVVEGHVGRKAPRAAAHVEAHSEGGGGGG